MLTFKRILLASDFSAPAEAALHYAATLAHQSQAPLLILHVIDTRVTALPRWSDIFRSTEVFSALEADETNAFEHLLAHPALTGLTVEPFMHHGNPIARIIDMAPYADLVVLGTRGQGKGWGDTTPGRVARQIAHRCPTAILLVPEGGGNAGLPAVGVGRLSVQRILVALPTAHYAPQALVLARNLATMCQATLRVVQVIAPGKTASYVPNAGAGLYHNPEAVKALARKRLAAIMPDDPAGPPVERVIMEGEASEVILHQSTACRSDLVIVSRHASSPLHRLFTLSPVEALIDHLLCPLVVVPFLPPSVPATTPGNGVENVGSTWSEASV